MSLAFVIVVTNAFFVVTFFFFFFLINGTEIIALLVSKHAASEQIA